MYEILKKWCSKHEHIRLSNHPCLSGHRKYYFDNLTDLVDCKNELTKKGYLVTNINYHELSIYDSNIKETLFDEVDND
jgi:hypothetical protein